MPKNLPRATTWKERAKQLFDQGVGINKICVELRVGQKALLALKTEEGWTRAIEHNDSQWSEAQKEIASNMWKDGKSARQIGSHFGITKNAAIGRLHRMGLLGGLAKPRPIKPPKPAAKLRRAAPYVPPPEIITEPTGTAYRFEDLDSQKCKWPIGEDEKGSIYCCRPPIPKRGASYCADHHRIGHNKPTSAPSAAGFRLRHGRRGI